MSINTIEEFETALMGSIETLFGSCKRFQGVLRSLPEKLGVSGSVVILEAAFEPGLSTEIPYPILHFHTTLAQKIETAFVPGILNGLNELNTMISAGAFPSFGCFGYYEPLRQIYLSYRMPVSPDGLDTGFQNAQFYLTSLYEQLDLFTDYILFLCNDPNRMSLQDYMSYLDTIADLNDLQARLDALEKIAKDNDGKGNGEEP